MPTLNRKTGLLELSPEELAELSRQSLSGMGWHLYHKYNVGSSEMPTWNGHDIYATAPEPDTDARAAARQRMAAQAAEIDHQRISARWDNILVQLFHGVIERSRSTGASHYVNSQGETVDQFGRPLKD